MSRVAQSLAVLFLSLSPSAACSPGGASGDVEAELAGLAGQPSKVTVVRDTADMYWAIPTVGMRHVGDRTIAVQAGTTVAGGTGEGPPGDVAQAVLDQWPDGGPYFMTMNEGADVNGQVGATNEEMILEVVEIVITRDE